MTCAARGRTACGRGEGEENKALPRHGAGPVLATVEINGKGAAKGRAMLQPLHKAAIVAEKI